MTRGTDWLSLDVPQIWAMIADHETEAHQRVVSGWRKTAELSQLHLHRLQAYRRELAATWSPTGSAAAREYLDRLDLLIATIRKTHDTASTNYTTFAAATSAVTQSRRDLQQIYDDYTAKAQIRLDYDRLMQERKAMGGGEIVNSAPPVSDQELQQLRGRARLVMYGLSSELQQAQDRTPDAAAIQKERRTRARQRRWRSTYCFVGPSHRSSRGSCSRDRTASAPSAGPPTTPRPIQTKSNYEHNGLPCLRERGADRACPGSSAPGVPPLTVPSTPKLAGRRIPPVLATPGGTGSRPAGRRRSLWRSPAVPEWVALGRIPRAGTKGPGRGDRLRRGDRRKSYGRKFVTVRCQQQGNPINPVGGLIGGTQRTTPAGRGPHAERSR